ncbi:hypothetical protein MRB53_000609 [Persea americana]|uniref:Uncharacterized protein n=1 Tax=Persea americana TaxID=3435 RepID=A0ACC2MQ84_PERAE|nr:hypothetical protein MRB53_000609 [Persea americana]
MTNPHKELPTPVVDKQHRITSAKLLLIDELAPLGHQQVPARRAVIDVPELPLCLVHVADGDIMHWRIRIEVQSRENRVCTEAWHREPSAIVGVAWRENLP